MAVNNDVISVNAEAIHTFYRDGCYRILLMETEDGEEISAKGNFGETVEGEPFTLYGSWETQYKKQPRRTFQCDFVVRRELDTERGMWELLSSGMIAGCGPAFAEKIIDRFGADTRRILDEEPDRLTEINGIGETKKEKIKNSWKKQRADENIGMFLFSIGIPVRHTAKVRQTLGESAKDIIQADPYALCEVRGIDFRTADIAAASLGIKKDSPQRIRSGILYAAKMCTSSSMGDTYTDEASLVRESVNITGISRGLIKEGIASMSRNGDLVVESGAVYTKKLYDDESDTAKLLVELAAFDAKPCWPMSREELEAETGIRYSETQLEAVRLAAMEKVLVITGGPGTGKSTILQGILKQYERSGIRVEMAAPTGRAAKKMNESTGNPAATIHRLLLKNRKEDGTEDEVQADAVIVDEASMIDISLMAWLLRSLRQKTRLLIIGDADQLPSVGPGTVLRDIIRSGVVKVIRLDRTYRQEEGSFIVENADRIKRGINPVFNKKNGGMYFFNMNTGQEDIGKKVVDIAFGQIPRLYGIAQDDIQVLSPVHKGGAGVEALNIMIQQMVNRDGEPILKTKPFRVGDRVMNIRNNYTKMIFNGDIGKILCINSSNREVTVEFDSGEAVFDYDELDDLVLCYASTVHKAQGSEYRAVVIPVVPGHFNLDRTLLYTAVTRAKEIVVLIGEKRAVEKAVRCIPSDKRKGRLLTRLIKEAKKRKAA